MFIGNNKIVDKFNSLYYNECIKDAGYLGRDFKNYYDGNVKMGDTPSLLYMMDGNPDDPYKESWGGSFERLYESPRTIFARNTTVLDTIPVYSVIEFQFKGPQINEAPDASCFTFSIDKQDWPGFYLGEGVYGVRYVPKAPAVLKYLITSNIQELNGKTGAFVVSGMWPGTISRNNYKLGSNWFTDKTDTELFEGVWQGYKTVEKWRNKVLLDWESRWNWLK